MRTKYNGEFSEKHIRQAIANKEKEAVDKLNRLYGPLLEKRGLKPMPYPNMKTRWITGRTAGRAISSRTRRIYQTAYNLEIIKLNFRAFMDEAPWHEVCHLFDTHLNGHSSHHGGEWQDLMEDLGLDPRRYHHYQIPEDKNNIVRFKCDCREGIRMGPIQAKKCLAGVQYYCKKCRGFLTPMIEE